MKRQILKNFISAWLSKFIKLGSSLLLVPIFIDELGKDGYGIVILLGSILSFSFFFEMGVRSGLLRFLAKSVALKDNQRFNEYLNTALAVYICVWIVLSVLLFIFAPHLTRSFNIPIAYSSLSITLLRTFGIITLFWSFTSPVFSAITSAYNRYDVTNYRQTIMGVISIVVLIIAVKFFNAGIVGWAVITVFFDALTTLSIIVIGFKLAPQIKLSSKFISRKGLGEMLSFGFVQFIGGWSRKLKIDADPLILSSFFGPASIPIYRSGVSMPVHSRPLIAALSGQIHTLSTSYYAQGDQQRLTKVFETGTKYTLLMGVPLLAVFIFFADDILFLWLGTRLSSEELKTATLCMQGMALVDFCFYLEGSSYAILYGMNKLKFMTFTDIFLGVINIVSSILLVKYSGWGLPSVILPTIILEGIARPYYLYYTAGVMGYVRGNIIPRIYLPVAIVLIVTCIGAYGVKLMLSEPSLIMLMISGIILGIIWLGITWIAGLTPQDRKDILATLNVKK